MNAHAPISAHPQVFQFQKYRFNNRPCKIQAQWVPNVMCIHGGMVYWSSKSRNWQNTFRNVKVPSRNAPCACFDTYFVLLLCNNKGIYRPDIFHQCLFTARLLRWRPCFLSVSSTTLPDCVTRKQILVARLNCCGFHRFLTYFRDFIGSRQPRKQLGKHNFDQILKYR